MVMNIIAEPCEVLLMNATVQLRGELFTNTTLQSYEELYKVEMIVVDKHDDTVM